MGLPSYPCGERETRMPSWEGKIKERAIRFGICRIPGKVLLYTENYLKGLQTFVAVVPRQFLTHGSECAVHSCGGPSHDARPIRVQTIYG